MNPNSNLIKPFGGLQQSAIVALSVAALGTNMTRPYTPVAVNVIGPTEQNPDAVIPDHILHDLFDYNVEGRIGKPTGWYRGDGEQGRPNTLFMFEPQLILFSYGKLMSSDSETVLKTLTGEGDGSTDNSTAEIYGVCVDERASLATRNARDGRFVVFDWRKQMARNQQNKDIRDQRTEFEFRDVMGIGNIPGERPDTTITHPLQQRMKAGLHSLGIAMAQGRFNKPEGMSDEEFAEMLEAQKAYWAEHWKYTAVSQKASTLEPGADASPANTAAAAVAEAAAQAPPVDEDALATV